MKRRDWTAARAKVDTEGRCRVCKRGGALQAAHIMGRKYDPPDGKVVPEDIVPLCQACHTAYDQRRLSLVAYLSLAEQAQAAGHVGLVRALARLDPDPT